MSKKHWSEMNTRELAEATRELDKEFSGEGWKPLTARDKALFKRSAAKAAAKAARGRPRIGKGAERINISIERQMLKKADALAKREGVKRSELIARGLAMLLKRQSA
jgi:hypothetical protein